jgi:hypothetical protein
LRWELDGAKGHPYGGHRLLLLIALDPPMEKMLSEPTVAMVMRAKGATNGQPYRQAAD